MAESLISEKNQNIYIPMRYDQDVNKHHSIAAKSTPRTVSKIIFVK